MPGLDQENLWIAIGWGAVSANLVWLALRWAFPKQKNLMDSSRGSHDDLPDREDFC